MKDVNKIRNFNNDFLIKKTIYSNNNKLQNYSISKNNFEEILNQVNNSNIKFSKHALQRLDVRNIKLDKEELNKIEEAVSKAEKKGVKEALILMGDTAFIASIKNRTIITTVTSEQLKESVFTNIDGAVII